MNDDVCGLCHKEPAEGYATIGRQRYCHGDDPKPTCYMRAQKLYTIQSLPGYREAVAAAADQPWGPGVEVSQYLAWLSEKE